MRPRKLGSRMINGPRKSIFGASMNYTAGSRAIDDLIGDFRTSKINLIPPFQRRRVWKTPARQKLLENILRGKPIPAIFLYKQASGQMYTYNILDGKQRLESILLFITNSREGVAVDNWKQYFFKGSSAAGFSVNVAAPGEKKKEQTFSELDNELVRNFREYEVPTIDINQSGVRVTRFDIIRTMHDTNKLLSDVFGLVAQTQRRGKDNFYNIADSSYTKVLRNLSVVKNLTVLETDSDGGKSTPQKKRELLKIEKYQEQADRMWERLLEIALFVRTRKHRTLAQILKIFDRTAVEKKGLTAKETAQLNRLFAFLRRLYLIPGVKESRLASDQPHFYTLTTSIIDLDLMKKYPDLKERLARLAKLLDSPRGASAAVKADLKRYLDLSKRQTTHPGRRQERQTLFVRLVSVV